jgi:hypothetical protein
MPRSMTRALEAAISTLSPADRRHLRVLAAEQDGDTALSRLLRGIAAELVADEWAEQALLQRLEAERRAHVDAVDLKVNGPLPPVVDGPAWWPESDPDGTP